jgi:hypothetical protein
MNTTNANQTTTFGGGTTRIWDRLRSACRRLFSPANLINSMTDAMHAEPSGAVEAAESWRTLEVIEPSGEELTIEVDDTTEPGPGHVAPTHAEVLLRSSCDLLCSQPAESITATALSLRTEPGITTHNLADMASLMAIEYGVLADVSIEGDHVHVRLTRRVPPIPSGEPANGTQGEAPIVHRGPRNGRK